MKKILSLVLAALMVFSILPAAFAAENATTAAETSDYQEAIDFLSTIGMYKGNGSGLAEKELVQRYQMAIFAARFKTGHTDSAYWATVENDSGFSDVTDFDGAGAETLGAISYASQAGIVNGVGGDIFDPTSNVTYRDALTMIVRALGFTTESYPWGYITKATELGLTDGITGVGPTDKIAREVVAQILYNALFADVNGTTVAESVFGVGQTVVMITASKKVSYNSTTVTVRDGKVRFAELNAQGEPMNTATYHGDYAAFGIANDAAANAAVGTTYYVTYKNNFAEILSAKSLATVYENNGDANVKLSGSNLVIGGQTLAVTAEFAELNNNQQWMANAKGDMGVKLYKSFGTAKKAAAGYLLGSDGNVWTLNGTTPVIYAYYSAILDAYYVVENGKYVEKNLDDILYVEAGASTSFTQKTLTTDVKKELYESAYAKFVANDANMDGAYDRVTYRTYAFGKIVKSTTDNVDYFNVHSTNGYNNTLTANANTYKVGDFRWTGASFADAAGKYVLYYIDEANKEIEIVKVIDASYQVSGYVRGIALDASTIDVNGTTYTIGYDTLAGSPLKTKNFTTDASKGFQNNNANLSNNISLIQPKFNQYVTLTILDGKVVKIDDASASNNFVIIDSFVDFTEAGIVANAYNTVNDTYETITIGAFNGWTVAGFDYYMYYLSNLIPGMTNTVNLPIQTYTVYKVVAVENGVYNLTTATKTATSTLSINQYGYILGTDGTTVADGKFVATNAKDYWLILDTTAKKVYSYTGKLNAATFANMDIYKVAENDYVLVGDASGIADTVFGANVSFMMYNTVMYSTNNNYWMNANNAYNYNILMTNVLTNTVETVQVDPALVSSWTGSGAAITSILENGKIYRVVDGKLSSTAAVTFETVANFYGNTSDYVAKGTKTLTNATATTIANAIANDAQYVLFPGFAGYASELAKKVTIYVPNGNGMTKYAYNGNLAYTNTDVTFSYVVAKDGSAIAWVSGTADTVRTGTLANVATAKNLSNPAGSYIGTGMTAMDQAVTVSYSLNKSTNKVTVTVAFATGLRLNADNDIIAAVSVDAGAATNVVATATTVNGLTTAITLTADVTAATNAVSRVDLVLTSTDAQGIRVEAQN